MSRGGVDGLHREGVRFFCFFKIIICLFFIHFKLSSELPLFFLIKYKNYNLNITDTIQYIVRFFFNDTGEFDVFVCVFIYTGAIPGADTGFWKGGGGGQGNC